MDTNIIVEFCDKKSDVFLGVRGPTVATVYTEIVSRELKHLNKSAAGRFELAETNLHVSSKIMLYPNP